MPGSFDSADSSSYLLDPERQAYRRHVKSRRIAYSLVGTAIVGPMGFGYAIQNGLKVPQATDGAAINFLLSLKFLAPEVMRLGNLRWRGWSDLLKRSGVMTLSISASGIAALPYLKGVQCAESHLGLNQHNPRIQAGNWTSYVVTAALYVPELFDFLMDKFGVDDPREETVQRAKITTLCEELTESCVDPSVLEEAIRIMQTQVNSTGSYGEAITLLNAEANKHRIAGGCPSWLKWVGKGTVLAITIPPFLAQSRSIATALVGMPWHGYGIFLPFTALARIPECAYVTGLGANLAQLFFDIRLVKEGLIGLLQDGFNLKNTGFITLGGLRVIADIGAIVATFYSAFAFDNQSDCGANLKATDKFSAAMGWLFNTLVGAGFLEAMSIADALGVNVTGVIWVFSLVALAAGTCLLSKSVCTADAAAHQSRLTGAKGDLNFEVFKMNHVGTATAMKDAVEGERPPGDLEYGKL